jgi:hypothetical protein
MSQWNVALGGSEAVAVIPVICGVLFGREMLVPMAGMTVTTLFEELAMAIREQMVPRRIYPLQWSFKTIVSAYNNFPEMDDLYSFWEAIQPFLWIIAGAFCSRLCTSGFELRRSMWTHGVKQKQLLYSTMAWTS